MKKKGSRETPTRTEKIKKKKEKKNNKKKK